MAAAVSAASNDELRATVSDLPPEMRTKIQRALEPLAGPAEAAVPAAESKPKERGWGYLETVENVKYLDCSKPEGQVHAAAMAGDVDKLMEVQESGLDVNGTLPPQKMGAGYGKELTLSGVTPLHLATVKGHTKMVQALLEAGAQNDIALEFEIVEEFMEGPMAGQFHSRKAKLTAEDLAESEDIERLLVRQRLLPRSGAMSEAGARASTPVRVMVQSLSGQTLELEADALQTVKALKLQIHAHWDFPPVCQKLILGSAVLEDLEALGTYLPEARSGDLASRLHLALVYSAPYGGDVHAATLAMDTEAVRILLQFRDRERQQKVPPALAVLMRPSLRRLPDWPALSEALQGRGYLAEEVDAAVAQVVAARLLVTYEEVLQRLEQDIGKRHADAEAAEWWDTAPM